MQKDHELISKHMFVFWMKILSWLIEINYILFLSFITRIKWKRSTSRSSSFGQIAQTNTRKLFIHPQIPWTLLLVICLQHLHRNMWDYCTHTFGSHHQQHQHSQTSLQCSEDQAYRIVCCYDDCWGVHHHERLGTLWLVLPLSLLQRTVLSKIVRSWSCPWNRLKVADNGGNISFEQTEHYKQT